MPLITKTPPQNKARWIQQCVIAGQDTVGFILGTELVWPEPSKWGLQADMSGLVKSTCEKLCQARAPWEGRTRLQTVRNEARTSSLVPATRPHAENPHCAIRQEEEAESKCTDWRGRNKAALIRNDRHYLHRKSRSIKKRPLVTKSRAVPARPRVEREYTKVGGLPRYQQWVNAIWNLKNK